jgi:hypothetical protein
MPQRPILRGLLAGEIRRDFPIVSDGEL